MTVVHERAKNNILVYYQCFLAVISVLVFFTEADNYFFDSGITPAPKNVVILFCLASAPLLILFKSRNFKYVPIGIILWCGLYLGVSAAYFLHSVPTEPITQELETRILTVLFILTMVVIFSGEPIVQKFARYALFIAVFITIFNNFIELFDPLAFNGFNETGRPAGFYKDPNKSGAALIMGLIFTIGLLPRQIRITYYLIIFIGAFITFSRGASLCLIILLIMFVYKRLISSSQLYPIISLLVMLLILGNVGNYLLDQASELGILNHSIEKRIEAITNIADPDAREADDGSSRSDVADAAWSAFAKRPFLGHGIGYIREWGKILPHNVYLTFMIEHGFLGATFLPLIVFAVSRKSSGKIRNICLFFGSFILVWAVFSNTILEDRETLMMFVLLAVLSKSSSFIQVHKSYSRS